MFRATKWDQVRPYPIILKNRNDFLKSCRKASTLQFISSQTVISKLTKLDPSVELDLNIQIRNFRLFVVIREEAGIFWSWQKSQNPSTLRSNYFLTVSRKLTKIDPSVEQDPNINITNFQLSIIIRVEAGIFWKSEKIHPSHGRCSEVQQPLDRYLHSIDVIGSQVWEPDRVVDLTLSPWFAPGVYDVNSARLEFPWQQWNIHEELVIYS